MTPIEIARIYKEAVELHDAIPEEEAVAKDLAAGFRSNLHQTLMETFRSSGIPFESRGDAARLAFEMVEREENRGTLSFSISTHHVDREWREAGEMLKRALAETERTQ